MLLTNKKGKVKKSKKDVNAPKKAKTSFLYYVEAKIEMFKSANTEFTHKEVIAKLGE